METVRKIGIDYDGTLIRKAPSYDFLRRFTKRGLPTIPGCQEALIEIGQTPGLEVLGLYTVRPEWLRGRQTRQDVARRGLPIEKIFHTANSPKQKVERLLLDSLGIPTEQGLLRDDAGLYVPDPNVQAVILVDDSFEKVIQGARELAQEKPEFKNLLMLFTLFAFNQNQDEALKGEIITGVVNVVRVKQWCDVKKCALDL